MSTRNNRRIAAAAATSPPVSKQEVVVPPSKVIRDAVIKGWDGGKAGAMAMGINVCTLMWIRTTMNYQYRHGTTTTQAMK